MKNGSKRLTASLFLMPALALAQGGQVSTTPPVTIVGAAPGGPAPETATSSFVVDEETIRNSSARNLSELLIEQGFTVEATPTDHGENTTLIRGFHTEHLMTEANGKLLILIDGRRSGVANVRQITLGNVVRVEVLRGPEMFKYSMGSPGGIVNVITRRGGPGPVGGSLRLGYGSYGAWRVGADVNGLLDHFDYQVGYERGAVRDDYKDGDGKRVHNTRTDRTERSSFNLGYTFEQRHRIGIDGYRYTVDKAHRPSYVDEEGEIRSNSYTDRKTELLHLNYEGSSRDGSLSWTASAGRGTDAYATYQADSRYPKGQKVDSDRAQGSLSWHAGPFDLSGGLDYIRYDVANSSTARGSFLARNGLDPVWAGIGYPMHPTSVTTLWGAYLVGTYRLMDGALNLSGGLRYESAEAKDLSVGDEHYNRVPYFTIRGIGSRDALPTRRSFDHVSPTIGVSWLPAEQVKLRANYTQGWRAPSGRQLFASSFYEDYGAPGDPRLEPEFTDAFELGVDVARQDWRLSATYFRYDVKDNVYIYPGVRPDGSGVQGRVMMNVDRRVQEGVELQASANVAGLLGQRGFELRPYLGVTHMTRKNEVLVEGGPGLLGQWWPITRMPDTAASFGLRFNQPAWGFSSNLNFNYYGEQYGGRANVGDGPLVPFGKFTVANLSMTQRLWGVAGGGDVSLKMGIDNLFDKTYSYLGRVPQDAYAYPGRSFHLTLIVDFR